MSLRKPRGEAWELPITPEKFQAETKKAHALLRCGACGWRCACGNTYSWARSRSDANSCHAIHQKAVIELITDLRNGKSNLDE